MKLKIARILLLICLMCICLSPLEGRRIKRTTVGSNSTMKASKNKELIATAVKEEDQAVSPSRELKPLAVVPLEKEAASKEREKRDTLGMGSISSLKREEAKKIQQPSNNNTNSKAAAAKDSKASKEAAAEVIDLFNSNHEERNVEQPLDFGDGEVVVINGHLILTDDPAAEPRDAAHPSGIHNSVACNAKKIAQITDALLEKDGNTGKNPKDYKTMDNNYNMLIKNLNENLETLSKEHNVNLLNANANNPQKGQQQQQQVLPQNVEGFCTRLIIPDNIIKENKHPERLNENHPTNDPIQNKNAHNQNMNRQHGSHAGTQHHNGYANNYHNGATQELQNLHNNRMPMENFFKLANLFLFKPGQFVGYPLENLPQGSRTHGLQISINPKQMAAGVQEASSAPNNKPSNYAGAPLCSNSDAATNAETDNDVLDYVYNNIDNNAARSKPSSFLLPQPFNAYDPTLNFIENAIDTILSNEDIENDEDADVRCALHRDKKKKSTIADHDERSLSGDDQLKKNLIQVCSCRIFKNAASK